MVFFFNHEGALSVIFNGIFVVVVINDNGTVICYKCNMW